MQHGIGSYLFIALACLSGHDSVIRVLLAAKANPNARNNYSLRQDVISKLFFLPVFLRGFSTCMPFPGCLSVGRGGHCKTLRLSQGGGLGGQLLLSLQPFERGHRGRRASSIRILIGWTKRVIRRGVRRPHRTPLFWKKRLENRRVVEATQEFVENIHVSMYICWMQSFWPPADLKSAPCFFAQC